MDAPPFVMQRAGPLVPLPALLAELRIPLAEVLDGTGIAPESLQPGAFISYAGAVAALERAARLSGLDDIGLRLGLRQTLGNLGPAGTVMRHSATLGEALGDFVRLQISNSTGAATYLQRTERDTAFGYFAYRISGQSSPQLHDMVIAAGIRFIAELSHDQARIEEIHTIRPRPASMRPYTGLGNFPIRFGQSQTCLYLSDATMSLALPETNPARKKAALHELQQMINQAPWGVRGRVRHTIGPMLASGRCSMPDTARDIGLHPRTLQRLLRHEGTTFEAIRNEVRFSAARDLLALTPLSVLEIALSLGYSTQSAFIHAFQRWSGTTPARWRDESGARTPPA